MNIVVGTENKDVVTRFFEYMGDVHVAITVRDEAPRASAGCEFRFIMTQAQFEALAHEFAMYTMSRVIIED